MIAFSRLETLAQGEFIAYDAPHKASSSNYVKWALERDTNIQLDTHL